MIVRNEEEADRAKIITILGLCSYCTEMLTYPYILTRDRNGNRYHPECAAKLASEIHEDLNQLKSDEAK